MGPRRGCTSRLLPRSFVPLVSLLQLFNDTGCFPALTQQPCSCLARRRRKRGVVPYYGTGWMAPNGKFNNGGGQNYPMNGQQAGYYNNNTTGGYYGGNNPEYGGGGGATYNPPPAYGAHAQEPQYTGTTMSPNDGYFGNAQYNSGLQSPPNAYQRDNVYPPPPAPPGGK